MTELTAEQQAAMEAQLMGDDPEAAQEAAEWLEANGYEIDYSALEGDQYQPPSEDEAFAQAVRGELGEDARMEALEAAGIPIAEEEPVDPSLLQEMAEQEQAELDGEEWDDDFEETRLRNSGARAAHRGRGSRSGG